MPIFQLAADVFVGKFIKLTKIKFTVRGFGVVCMISVMSLCWKTFRVCVR